MDRLVARPCCSGLNSAVPVLVDQVSNHQQRPDPWSLATSHHDPIPHRGNPNRTVVSPNLDLLAPAPTGAAVGPVPMPGQPSFRPTGAFHTRVSEQRAGHRAADLCSLRTNRPSSTSSCRVSACRSCSARPSSSDVRRLRRRGCSDPRRFRSGWGIRRRGRAAPAFPRHHRHREGAGMCPDDRRMEAAVPAAPSAGATAPAITRGVTSASSRAARRSSRSARPAAGSRRTAPGLRRHPLQAGGVAAAGGIGVGRGDQRCRPGRSTGPAEAAAARRRSPDPSRRRSRHTACRSATALDRRQAQRVDRRLAHRDAASEGRGRPAGGTASCRRPPRNCANRGRASRSRSAIPRRPGARTRRCRAGLPGRRRPRARP